MVMDGTEITKVREALEVEAHYIEEEEGVVYKVFESWGGTLPRSEFSEPCWVSSTS
jgi:hypothetical protein